MIMCSVLAVALLAVFVVVAVLLRNGDTGVRFQRSDQAAMVGIGILLACGVMLFAIARVRADAEGIEVRNVLITRRFAWSDVLSVSFPDGASWARLELPDEPQFDGASEARAVGATCGGVRVWSVYVPNGREPDNPHYAYKLEWLSSLHSLVASEVSSGPFAVLGDFNVAPTDADVGDIGPMVPPPSAGAPRRGKKLPQGPGKGAS
jgi:hypothetical protein